MQVKEIFEEIEFENTSLDDEFPPTQDENLFGFESINLDDDVPVMLMKDQKVILSDTLGNTKDYLINEYENLFGHYNIVYNGMTIYELSAAG